jgi:DNA-binding NarL/FixJ family response regulator
VKLKPDMRVKAGVMPGVRNLEGTGEIARRLPATATVPFSFDDLPELEIIAKAAGVHGEASKNPTSLIQAIEKALHPSANRQSTTSDGVREPACPQPEDVP